MKHHLPRPAANQRSAGAAAAAGAAGGGRLHAPDRSGQEPPLRRAGHVRSRRARGRAGIFSNDGVDCARGRSRPATKNRYRRGAPELRHGSEHAQRSALHPTMRRTRIARPVAKLPLHDESIAGTPARARPALLQRPVPNGSASLAFMSFAGTPAGRVDRRRRRLVARFAYACRPWVAQVCPAILAGQARPQRAYARCTAVRGRWPQQEHITRAVMCGHGAIADSPIGGIGQDSGPRELRELRNLSGVRNHAAGVCKGQQGRPACPGPHIVATDGLSSLRARGNPSTWCD